MCRFATNLFMPAEPARREAPIIKNAAQRTGLSLTSDRLTVSGTNEIQAERASFPFTLHSFQHKKSSEPQMRLTAFLATHSIRNDT